MADAARGPRLGLRRRLDPLPRRQRASTTTSYDVWDAPAQSPDRRLATLLRVARRGGARAGCSTSSPTRTSSRLGRTSARGPTATCAATTSSRWRGSRSRGIAVEVSTAGLRKPVGEIYPARAFLEMALDAGNPIALSSDAHAPEQLGFGYDARAGGCSTRLGVDASSRSFERPRAAAASRSALMSVRDRHRLGLAPPRAGRRLDPRRRRRPARPRARRATPTPTSSTHAVIDALLGAAGLGDIGQHFPDTDERWRDADSIGAAARASSTAWAPRGLAVVHVDATVVLERPKLAPAPRGDPRSLADALGVDREHVNVKATTGEGMGFVGREEGVAALAVATLAPRPRADARRRACWSPSRCSASSGALLVLAGRLTTPYPILLVVGGVLLGLVPGMPRRRGRPRRHPARRPAAAALPGGVLQLAARDARRTRARSCSLAIGLVVATTAGVAVVAHEVAGLPWAPAFVLGAVLSPTDPIAASAIASRLGAPRRFVTIVEGESLVNDATGLILYKLAVAAAVGSGVTLARGRGDLRRQRRGRRRDRARGGLVHRPGARAACEDAPTEIVDLAR